MRSLIFSALLVAAQTVSATPYVYQIDDGKQIQAWGCGSCGAHTLLWGNHFTVAAGHETITAIQASFGWPDDSPNLGQHPITASLWSDPNGDGNPFDATLLTEVGGVVANWGTGLFNTYAFSSPVTLFGTSFFATITMALSAGYHPATATLGDGSESWIGLGEDLATAEGLTSLNEINGSSFMVRAVSVPEPGTLALLGVGLIGAMMRRKYPPAASCNPDPAI